MSWSIANTAAMAAIPNASVMSRYFGRAPPATSAIAPIARYTRPVPKSGCVMIAKKGTRMKKMTFMYSRRSSRRPP